MPPKHHPTFPVDQLTEGLEETRLDLGLSRATIARFAGLTTSMVGRLERGKCSNLHAAVKLRTALTMLELSAPPSPTLDDDLTGALRLLGEPPPLPHEVAADARWAS